MSSRRHFLKNAALAAGGAVVGAAGLNQISPRIWREPTVFEPNRSYWARSQPPQNPPLTDDIAADVAVSAGALQDFRPPTTSAASPREARCRPGSEGCGNGASGRNGAMVLTMTDDRYMSSVQIRRSTRKSTT